MIYKTGLSESDVSAMEGCIKRYKSIANAVNKAKKLAGLIHNGIPSGPLWIRLRNDKGDAETMLDKQLQDDLGEALDGFLAREVERLKELKLVLGQGGEAE
jgi:hypothetical protein